MKVKNWLYPVVLAVSTLMVAIALFLPFYNYVYSCGLLTGEIWGTFDVFTNFAGLDLYPEFIGITATFASSYLILGFTGVLLSLVLTILKMCGFEIKQYGLCNKILAGMALIGTAGFVVSAILFVCINTASLNIPSMPDATRAIVGLFPLWMAMAGLILGTIASFLGARDIAEEEIAAAPTKIKKTAAPAEKVAPEEEKVTAKSDKVVISTETPGQVIIETKAPVQEEKPQDKPAEKKPAAKSAKPAQKAKKTTSAEAKFVAKKSAKKTTTKKSTTKKTAKKTTKK